ncbi:hypothetical protein PG993_006202 [Apiospora rasikravindrae]|uniref:Tat pathway signal sequence n=1 Tax=Apiospora rasikravindrae TaxID=990691 RepID=A0ABR1T526_9PEZI
MSAAKEYKPYTDDSSEAGSAELPLQGQFWRAPWPAPRNRSRWLLIAALGTSVFFAGLSAWLGVQVIQLQNSGSFGRGFPNELGPAKHLIEVESQWFEGSPAFLDDGFEYVPPPDDGIPRLKYTGDPTLEEDRKEMDRNWAMYHWGRFFLLEEHEAREAWGPDYQKYHAPKQGGYVAALEVMHTIHCLVSSPSLISTSPSLYELPEQAKTCRLHTGPHPQGLPPRRLPPDNAIHGVKHIDHCINHLRQVILCAGDLTPIPSVYFMGIENNYINSDRPHTCRNFKKIRDWVSERFNGSLAVLPEPGSVDPEEWKKLNGLE